MPEEFPSQIIRIVVPYPPGGSADSIARLLAEGLGKELNQSVVVENRAGAATNVGADYVVKSRADGYTLLFGGSGLVANAVFGPRPGFDPRGALVPVSTVAEVPFVLAVQQASPIQSLTGLTEAARARPGRLTLASAQLDTHVEMLKLRAGVEFLHVPYRGGAQAVTDTMSGQVDAVLALAPVLLPLFQSARLRPLGVSSELRLKGALQDIPTFRDGGVDFALSAWFGLQAPQGVDRRRLARLNAATRRVVDSAEFGTRMTEVGARASSSTPQAMGRLLDEQRIAWESLASSHPQLVDVR